MSSSTNKKIRTGMRLDEDMIKRLDEEARGMGWTRTMLVQQALAKFLAERGNPTTLRVIL